MNNLDSFLKKNANQVPEAPLNEWSQIMARIENSKNFWELIREAITSRTFWLSAGLSTACALVLVVKLSAPVMDDNQRDDEFMAQAAQLYSEDLQLSDNDFVE